MGNEAMTVLLNQSYAQRTEYIGMDAWKMDTDCISLEPASMEERHRY